MPDDAKTRVLKALATYGRLKVSEVVGHTEVTWRHLDRIMPEMEKDKLIKSYREGNKKIYEITSDGTDYLRREYDKILGEYDAIFQERRRQPAKTGIEIELPQQIQPTRLHSGLPVAGKPTLKQLKRRFLDAVRDGDVRLAHEEALDQIFSDRSYLETINGILEESRSKKAEISLEKDPKRINVRLWL